MKKEYVRTDGTCALYLYLNLGGKQKKIPLNISVPKNCFDDKKQRIKKNYALATDYNIIIEKILSNINTIEVNYRLSGEAITFEKVMEDLYRPSLRINFNTFAEQHLENTKDTLRPGTYRQQKGALAKIKEFRDPLLFSEINEELIGKFKIHLKKKRKNKPSTIEGTLKNLKKYIHAAQKKGVRMDFDFTEIKVKKMTGDITFLLPDELKKLYEYYHSPFIPLPWKNILCRYLFSCFTGLRISDIETISKENFIGDYLAFTMQKTTTFIKIKLNDTAKSLVKMPYIFDGNYTREHINRELKKIAKAVSIKKNIHYHTSRHTFATNYLLAGGQVQHLQKLLGHSKIETTMVYVHEVEQIMNDEIKLMDKIVTV